MSIFGCTRTRIHKDHALISPESFVRSTLPGWENSDLVILISPAMGARFVQYLALLPPGAKAGRPAAGIERVIYVLDGQLTLTAGREERQLLPGTYAYIPLDAEVQLQAATAARLNVFEKRYVPLPGAAPPRLLVGAEQSLEGVPFQGDADALLKTLLPEEPSFDLAVNIFTFQPGAALPIVEAHVMEHGLLMLQGQGVYRLAESWYPVCQGDVIWMAPYCPQWFVAMGKEPARYLYYKDVNRQPLE